MLVALKLNHRINDVLQNLWSGKRSLLINMSYQNNRNATRLGKSEQGGCTLANLGTEPGELSTSSVAIVWIESITISCGATS